MFHPKEELIISNSEDKTIRIWDIARQHQPVVVKRENDRFWILEAHPNLNLLAAGHDSGLLVFKLARERPPMTSNSKFVYYCKAPYVYEVEVKTQRQQPIFSTSRTRGSSLLSLEYNYANRTHHCVLLTDVEGSYQLFVSPKRDTNAEAAPLRGFGRSAVFVSSRKFAVLDKSRQLWIKSLENEVKTKIKLPVQASHVFSGGHPGRILLRSASAMMLYDVNSPKIINHIPTQSRFPIKYVVWSGDKKYVAMFSQTHIYVADSKLQSLCMITESTRVKSGSWDLCGVFIYSTSTHLKYLLTNGDSGIIRTLPEPIYITAVARSTVFYIGRDQACASIAIDSTEYLFKMALSKKRNREVLRLMESKKLIGRSIISYLQKKGYPEVALHFVEDPKIKFNLALECGNIAVALECASLFDNKESWHKLGVEALRQGNHQVVEAAYQKTKNFERLSFLYLITGNIPNLSKMLHISKLRDDTMGRLHNALFLGNVEERVEVLAKAGLLRFAYLVAKTHGLEDHAAQLAAQMEEQEIELPPIPENTTLLQPPIPVLRQTNWPLLEVEKGFFDQIEDAAEGDEKGEDDVDPDDDEGAGEGWDTGGLLGDDPADDEQPVEAEENGWGDMGLGIDLGEDEVVEEETGPVGFVMPTEGASPQAAWSQSTLAADMAAAGNFQMAMHLLNRQVGIVNFEPLRANFMKVLNSARGFSPSLPNLAWQSVPVFRDEQSRLPKQAFTLASCADAVKRGYKAVTEGKFQRAVHEFRSLLYMFPLLVVDSKAEVKDVEDLRHICSSYLTAVRLDLRRKEEKTAKAQAALAAYFTKCDLQPVHRILGFRVAIKFSYQSKNFKTTASFCRSLLELAAMHKTPTVSKIVNPREIRGVMQKCEKLNTDKDPIDFDESKAFFICARSFTPVYTGREESAQCPFCFTKYHRRFEDSMCDNCELSKIGTEASGLRSFPE
jgi:coatomer protein complex subunit alpha (xenin)